MVSVLFHLPYRDAFHLSLTVLVHYRSEVIFSLGRVVLPDSNGISPVPSYLRTIALHAISFRIRDYYPLWSDFPDGFTKICVSTPVNRVRLPRNPVPRYRSPPQCVLNVSEARFRLFRVRSPLLTESHIVFFSSWY